MRVWICKTATYGVSGADEAVNALSSEVGGANSVGSTTSGGNLGTLTADNRVSDLDNESVDVDTKVAERRNKQKERQQINNDSIIE